MYRRLPGIEQPPEIVEVELRPVECRGAVHPERLEYWQGLRYVRAPFHGRTRPVG
jgi:hypothetical protein